MASRLQLDDGNVKKYDTYFSCGGGEDCTPLTFESKCGLKQFNKECDHLDCAIDVTEREISRFKFGLKFGLVSFAVLSLLSILIDQGKITSWLQFWSIMMFALLTIDGWDTYWSSKKQKELIEFRNHGTINGVKAHRL